MRDRVKRALGLEHHSRDVLEFFGRSNANVGYYAGIMLAFAWVVVLLMRIVIHEAYFYSALESVSIPLFMLLCNVALIWLSRRYLKGKISRTMFQNVLVVYMFVSVLAGAFASLIDFVAGGQLVIFFLQVVLCVCLFVAPPIGSLVLTAVAFAALSVALVVLHRASTEMLVVMLVSWVAIVAVSVGRYRQTLAAARRESELRVLSVRDDLTGLPNRRALRLNFPRYVDRPVVVVMVDIDDFKFVNDACGHTAGDAILADFADIVCEYFPREDFYRYGGDEFLGIFDPSDGDLRARAESMRAVMESVSEPEVRAAGYKLASSAGYVHGIARNVNELRQMVTLADENLLRAKQRGKGIMLGSEFQPSEGNRELDESLLQDRGVDGLTGMPTRSSFRRQARELLNRAEREGATVCFVHFDIEDFKIYNHQKGYEGGDELLRRMGTLVKTTFSDGVTSHLSDDHFLAAVLVTDDFEQRVKTVCEGVSSLGEGLVVAAKAGIFVHKPDDAPIGLSLMCDCAKIACDSVKGRYDSLYCYFTDEMMARVKRRHHIVNSFDQALSERQVRVSYQRVVRTITEKVCGFEALAKWDDPEHGLIPPSEFVPVLEDARLIHKLDLRMLQSVCADHRAAIDAGLNTLPTSVNLSRLDFELCDLATEVKGILSEYDIDPALIHFEITESSLSDSPDTLMEGIVALRSMGHEVWVDDFGSGFSSLNMLKHYEFDTLKIDMEFFRVRGDDGASDERARRIVASIVNMAKMIGVGVVAEGVVNEEQRNFLSRIGCSKIQGELYGLARYTDEEIFLPGRREQMIETVDERAYFDAIGEVNMLSADPLAELDDVPFLFGRPIAVVEFTDEGMMHYLQVNRRYMAMIEEAGTTSLAKSEERFNTPGPFRDRALVALRECEEAPGKMRYAIDLGRTRYNIDASFIVRREGASAFLAEVQCFDLDETS